MEFQRVVERRRMVRAFQDRPVPDAVVERILANGMRAPSAGHTQGWRFLVLTGEAERTRFWDAGWPAEQRRGSKRRAIVRAPLIVVVCGDKQAYLDRYAEPDKGWTDRDEARWPVAYWEIDAAFAAMIMLLTAADERLGALFFGLRDPQAVKAAFAIPEPVTPIGAIALGYPAPDEPSPSLLRGRSPRDQIVRRGRW